MAKKITPTIEREILAKAAQGESSRAIATWLLAAHKITISHQAVGNMLRQTRLERADVAAVVVREALAGHVTSDLDILAKEQERVDRLSARLHARAHELFDVLDEMKAGKDVPMRDVRIALAGAASYADLALKASDRVDKLAGRKLHFAGADPEDGGSGIALADLDELKAAVEENEACAKDSRRASESGRSS